MKDIEIIGNIHDFEVVQKLRKMSSDIPEEKTVGVPSISPDKWFDGAIERPEMVDLPFVDVPLAKLLHFIADMI